MTYSEKKKKKVSNQEMIVTEKDSGNEDWERKE